MNYDEEMLREINDNIDLVSYVEQTMELKKKVITILLIVHSMKIKLLLSVLIKQITFSIVFLVVNQAEQLAL